ncbi:MAG TPA: tetratricopeptide repeat protein [Acidobacteriaceae bacterium]|nr:tetratricopeptide repeat protein [Acidobacteriaceae bacterium]
MERRRAFLMHRDGREDEAEKKQREVLATERAALGPRDQRTVGSMSQLAGILVERGHYADAANLNRETLDLRLELLTSTVSKR